jgi:hypothetical protein
MRVGLVSGDGLPVSGLLTIFRNVIDIGRAMGVLELPIPTDLGFAWRPDKPQFFPTGDASMATPAWMLLAHCPAVILREPAAFADELTALREHVARSSLLSALAQKQLPARIARLAAIYYEHFTRWLSSYDLDWVIALNMTLSDAVPATTALHRAIHDRFADRRRGGVVFWDHDLFQSCAIRDPGSGLRIYPEQPNAYTPLPGRNAYTRWVVVSEALAKEAANYPTDLTPIVVPNILPALPVGEPDERHRAFARQLDLDLRRPVLLNPVRIFRVKGVHIALHLLAALKGAAEREQSETPYLLVFGSLQEDAEYGREVVDLVHDLDIVSCVRFLDGVPLTSYCDTGGCWRLDERDLLHLSVATSGGVVFTPAVPDVETVGLGPGLGAQAGLPCAVTKYDAFESIYGSALACVQITPDPDGIERAGVEYFRMLQRQQQRDRQLLRKLQENQRLIAQRFPREPWRNLWQELQTALLARTKRSLLS